MKKQQTTQEIEVGTTYTFVMVPDDPNQSSVYVRGKAPKAYQVSQYATYTAKRLLDRPVKLTRAYVRDVTTGNTNYYATLKAAYEYEDNVQLSRELGLYVDGGMVRVK